MLAQGFLHPGREFARLGSVRPSRNGCARRRRSRGSGCGNLFMGNASWIRNIACPISTSSITISLLCAMRWPSDLSREAGDKHWRAKRSQSPSRSTAQASSLSWRASLLTARRKISFADLPLKNSHRDQSPTKIVGCRHCKSAGSSTRSGVGRRLGDLAASAQ